jgi:poly(3-hydroxyalkanoate) synthetase
LKAIDVVRDIADVDHVHALGFCVGGTMAFTFGTLRANDLIWRYVVDSYMKGVTADAFDLLFWDSDSVSLPGPMYCWYTRNTYLDNKIKEPGATTQCGARVDLSKAKIPVSHCAVAKRLSLEGTHRTGPALCARCQRSHCRCGQSAGPQQAQLLDPR